MLRVNYVPDEMSTRLLACLIVVTFAGSITKIWQMTEIFFFFISACSALAAVAAAVRRRSSVCFVRSDYHGVSDLRVIVPQAISQVSVTCV